MTTTNVTANSTNGAINLRISTLFSLALVLPVLILATVSVRAENGFSADRQVKSHSFVLVDGAADVPLPPPCASSRIDAIKHRGVLRVAVLNEYPSEAEHQWSRGAFRGTGMVARQRIR